MFCDKINIDTLEYKPPTSNRSGGKVVHVSTVAGSTDWKDRLRFQMSENDKVNLQEAVWGLSTPLPGQDVNRRTLELTIESPELLTFLDKLDKNNLSTAVKQAPEWFRKSVEEDAVRNMYVSLVKQPVKPDQKPTVRVKVKSGEYPTNIYVVTDTDEDGNITYSQGTVDDLTRKVKCLVMVETVGLWFMSRQFGMSLTATQILVWPNRRSTGIDSFTMSTTTKLHKASIAPSISMAPAQGDEMDVADVDM